MVTVFMSIILIIILACVYIYFCIQGDRPIKCQSWLVHSGQRQMLVF